MSHSRRFRAAIAAAVMIATAGIATATAGPSQAAPQTCEGVWVVVQPDQQDATTAAARCAAEFSTGAAALASAGFSVENDGAMLARIDGAPEDADFTSNGGYYWSYWSAPVNADGTLGGWDYYQVGADQSEPVPGQAEGWLLTNDAAATGPALSALPEETSAAPSPAPTTPPATIDSGTPAVTVVIVSIVLVVVLAIGIWWARSRRPS